MVRVEPEFLDFNYCEYGRASEFKEVIIENSYPHRVEVHWITHD